MRENFPGFYRPTDDEFSELWKSALIVPDTNILLAFYRLSEPTRDKLFQILEALQERLFVPYQVGFEFQMKRLDVIDKQKRAYETVEKKIKGFAGSVGGGLAPHPRLNQSDLEARISKALEPVAKHLSEIREKHPDPLEGDDGLGGDLVRDKLEALIAGRLGEPHDVDDLIQIGRKRYERKEPPGYEDEKKDEPERYGDLAIWLEMIAKAREAKQGIVFVTEERKADWWSKHDNRTVSPHHALIEEMRSETQQRFYIYRLESFMERASSELKISLSEDDRDDVARAGDATQAEVPGNDRSWYTTVVPTAPIASGFVYPHEGTAYFPASPASGAVRYPTGSRALKRTWLTPRPQSWQSTVEEKGEEVVLGIAWEPYIDLYAQGQFHCFVTTPGGETQSASTSSPDLTASLTFPRDFSTTSEPETGTYRFQWFYQGAGALAGQSAATGSFELTAPEEAAGTDES